MNLWSVSPARYCRNIVAEGSDRKLHRHLSAALVSRSATVRRARARRPRARGHPSAASPRGRAQCPLDERRPRATLRRFAPAVDRRRDRGRHGIHRAAAAGAGHPPRSGSRPPARRSPRERATGTVPACDDHPGGEPPTTVRALPPATAAAHGSDIRRGSRAGASPGASAGHSPGAGCTAGLGWGDSGAPACRPRAAPSARAGRRRDRPCARPRADAVPAEEASPASASSPTRSPSATSAPALTHAESSGSSVSEPLSRRDGHRQHGPAAETGHTPGETHASRRAARVPDDPAAADRSIPRWVDGVPSGAE